MERKGSGSSGKGRASKRPVTKRSTYTGVKKLKTVDLQLGTRRGLSAQIRTERIRTERVGPTGSKLRKPAKAPKPGREAKASATFTTAKQRRGGVNAAPEGSNIRSRLVGRGKKGVLGAARTLPKGEKTKVLKAKASSHKIEVTTTRASEAPSAEYFVNPPVAVLRSFRKAAAENRKAAKLVEKRKSSGENFLAKPLKDGKRYTVDLRVHSPATVGYFSTGGVNPGPALVRLAKVKGIDMIGITDYCSAASVDHLKEVAADSGVTIVPGFDLCCQIGECREVFITSLFPEATTGEQLYGVLAELGVPSDAYGRRDFVVTKDFGAVLAAIERVGGVVIPTRVDKTPYRLLAVPALVDLYGIHTFDLVHPEITDYFRERWPDGRFTFLTFSNANALAQLGSRLTKIRLAAPGFEGIKQLVARREVAPPRKLFPFRKAPKAGVQPGAV